MQKNDDLYWQPTASLENLRLRAAVLKKIRVFFEERDVLEVETPLLCRSTVTDPHLASFETTLHLNSYDTQTLYLQTSPEYAMKRLLASGSGSIYQLCKAFRNGESGRKHNPEFTMLEWYRTGFDHHALMDEVSTFLTLLLETSGSERLSYRELFLQYFGINPHDCKIETLRELAEQHALSFVHAEECDRDMWLDLLLTHIIEPTLGKSKPIFIYDYPASQAALARTRSEENYSVGERFEVYYQGVELANGYHELGDPVEQLQRFNQENQLRLQRGLSEIPIDRYFMASLAFLPHCAGVALGIDRLVSLIADSQSINDIIAFPIANA